MYCCCRFLFRAIYAFFSLAVSSIVKCSLKILIPTVNKIKASHLSRELAKNTMYYFVIILPPFSKGKG